MCHTCPQVRCGIATYIEGKELAQGSWKRHGGGRKHKTPLSWVAKTNTIIGGHFDLYKNCATLVHGLRLVSHISPIESNGSKLQY